MLQSLSLLRWSSWPDCKQGMWFWLEKRNRANLKQISSYGFSLFINFLLYQEILGPSMKTG